MKDTTDIASYTNELEQVIADTVAAYIRKKKLPIRVDVDAWYYIGRIDVKVEEMNE